MLFIIIYTFIVCALFAVVIRIYRTATERTATVVATTGTPIAIGGTTIAVGIAGIGGGGVTAGAPTTIHGMDGDTGHTATEDCKLLPFLLVHK